MAKKDLKKVNEVSKQTCQRILPFIFQNYISIPLFTCKIYLREEKGIAKQYITISNKCYRKF